MKVTDQTKQADFRNKRATHRKEIKGWGIDANRENNPTYPMKQMTGKEHEGYSWDRPTLQEIDIEILRSVERPNISATFGTSVPPSGLSGFIRRLAFKYSESSYGRWIPLMLADRINAVEGIIDDLRHGHIPNIIAERGWRSEWKYNRKAVIRKLMIGAVVTTVAITYFVTAGSKKPAKHIGGKI
jgi:hypothetical protein